MKYQGMVLKLTKNKALVTTEDFQCYYIKRSPTICIGKEVEFTSKEIIKKTHTLTRWALSIACAIFIITSFMHFAGIIDINNILYSPQVFAYVSVDINPSFEMEIDYKGRVLNLIPLDEDAGVILNNIKFDKLKISKVIDNIIKGLKTKGGASKEIENHILISSALNWEKEENKGNNEDIQEKRQRLDIIMDSVKNDMQNNDKTTLYLLQADIKQREDAKREGISTSRYIVYKSLKNDLSIEEVKNTTVSALIKNLADDKLEMILGTSQIQMPTQEPTSTISTPTPTTPTPPTPAQESTPPAPTQEPTPTISTPPAPTQEPTPTISTPPAQAQESTPIPAMSIPTSEPLDSMYRRFESSNYRGYFIRIESFSASISSYVDPVEDSIFRVVPGLAEADCISFESINHPGHYLKHENYEIVLKKYEDTHLFKADATYRIVPGLADESMVSFQSFNFPNRYIRHREYTLYIEEVFTELEKKDATYIELKVN